MFRGSIRCWNSLLLVHLLHRRQETLQKSHIVHPGSCTFRKVVGFWTGTDTHLHSFCKLSHSESDFPSRGHYRYRNCCVPATCQVGKRKSISVGTVNCGATWRRVGEQSPWNEWELETSRLITHPEEQKVSYTREYFKKTLEELKICSKNQELLKWSLWWALASCGVYQVQNYTQSLWKQMQTDPDDVANGVVEFVNTCLGAFLSFFIHHLSINWTEHGQLILFVTSAVVSGLLYVCSQTTTVLVAYVSYIVISSIYHMLITAASWVDSLLYYYIMRFQSQCRKGAVIEQPRPDLRMQHVCGRLSAVSAHSDCRRFPIPPFWYQKTGNFALLKYQNSIISFSSSSSTRVILQLLLPSLPFSLWSPFFSILKRFKRPRKNKTTRPKFKSDLFLRGNSVQWSYFIIKRWAG